MLLKFNVHTVRQPRLLKLVVRIVYLMLFNYHKTREFLKHFGYHTIFSQMQTVLLNRDKDTKSSVC